MACSCEVSETGCPLHETKPAHLGVVNGPDLGCATTLTHKIQQAQLAVYCRHLPSVPDRESGGSETPQRRRTETFVVECGARMSPKRRELGKAEATARPGWSENGTDDIRTTLLSCCAL